jgi:AcrR family transcriptional regulator
MIRQENPDPMKCVTIMRGDKDTIYRLIPKTKEYTEMKGKKGEFDFNPADPYSRLAKIAVRKPLGKESINGYVCDKTKFIFKDKARGTITMWFSVKLRYPIKTEMDSPRGHVYVECKNIKEGRVAKSLFEIPKGYKKTHVTGLIRELGITATLFYAHFPSKRRLLAECVTELMRWSFRYVDGRQAHVDDPSERLLWRIFGHSRVFELGPAALAVIREESPEDPAAARSIEEGLDQTVARILEDLDQQKARYPQPSQFPGWLIALNLFGAYEHLAFRSQFDERHSRRDLLESHLWLFLAAQAARNGEVDIDSRVARYRDLIDKLSSELPPLPPELELETGAQARG